MNKRTARLPDGPVRLASGVIARVRHETVAFAPVPDSGPASGRMLDDELSFEEDPPSSRRLSLVVPPRHSGPGESPRAEAAPRDAVRDEVRPPPPSLRLAPPPLSISTPATPQLALLAFSGFPSPPTSVFETPGYALHVLTRRRTLARELAAAKARSSPDIELYERALASADDRAVSTGIVLLLATFSVPIALLVALVV